MFRRYMKLLAPDTGAGGSGGGSGTTPGEPGTQVVPPTTPASGGVQVTLGQAVQDPPATPQPGEGTGDEWDRERAKKTIDSLREQEKAWKASQKELAELRQKAQDAENAKLTEDEKLQKRLKELETKEQSWESERKQLLQEQTIDRAIALTDAKYPDLVALKVSVSKLEIGEDGRPTKESLDAQLKVVKETYPDLFGKGAAETTAPGMPPSGSGTNPAKKAPLTFETVSAMTPAEVLARKGEIDEALRQGLLKPRR